MNNFQGYVIKGGHEYQENKRMLWEGFIFRGMPSFFSFCFKYRWKMNILSLSAGVRLLWGAISLGNCTRSIQYYRQVSSGFYL